ncbi:flagellar associated protein, putative (macronuclear) [Tetrahymena thermophila SB210]|uniref:Flagellar associated protein, putative n=1 Tax=Tetrahymena thermophila (strain SB210) TaxID=312017 RepID=W7WVU8_TETTS|nr:flagellar associated protein, putative [Tetrahymena thermophila SB210]EWS70940.1 flagellar associated protein, putative [Tetrahymena thermophila SB210]|eukprot:XP_012656496.1 flagellar associated protein, putative [Tetrahymena thermophila SB210]
MKKYSQGNKEVARPTEDQSNLDGQNLKQKEGTLKENRNSAKKQKDSIKVNNNTSQSEGQYKTSQDEDQLQNENMNIVTKNSIQNYSQSQNNQNLTTLKYISNSDPIDITPNEIHFKDIQINQTYEITLYVRNLTKKPRRIRVFQPQTPHFRADYEMQGAIGAGLAMKVTVTFETTYLDNFKDVMKIVSQDNFSKEVFLYAYQPCAQLVFEPFINFGFVKVQQQKQEKIFFKNEGSVAAKVELKSSDPADLKIEPPFFSIQPKQEFAVTATYESQEAGLFRGFVYVTTEAQCLQKVIDINATIVEFTQFLIDDSGNQTTQFDFGTFYYGQEKKIHGFLVNNTPKKYKYKVNFRFGLLYSAEDIASLQTPNEVGREQTEKIMSIEPSEGVIDSYSQLPIVFKCHSQVHPKHQFWTQSYAISKDEMNADVEDYSYSAIFSYDGQQSNPTIIHVTGRGICPTIKLSKNLIQYGECNVNDYKDCKLEIENRNRDIPISISCSKIPYFTLSPATAVINPQSKAVFVASFQPKAVGSFQKNMQILLFNGAYKLDLKMLGKALDISEKTITKRGPETLPENFENERKFLDEENLFQTRTKKQYEDRINEIPDWVVNNKDPTVMDSYMNSKKYDDVLREHRKERLQKEKDKIVAAKYEEMIEKLKQLGLAPDQDGQNQGAESDEEGKGGKFADAPIDYAYEVGMIQNRLDTPELPLPISNEPLYVNKPIGKYEPYAQNQENMKSFNPDPNVIIKKKWHSKPQNHKEIREISMKLQGEQLQKIFAGPVFIDFGPVYVKSTIQKTFTIRNDLRTAISCRLIVDSDELQGSYQTLQIIPPSQVAGFDVVLKNNTLGQFRNNVKYIINEQHAFEFQVIADIQLVKLELSRVQIKMSFFEDNHEMITKETLKLTNNGNSTGKFEWVHTLNKIFTITPEKGEVPANSSLNLTVTYKPSQQAGSNSISSQNNLSANAPNSARDSNQGSNQNDKQSMAPITRNEEEKLVLKVQDGVEGAIRCIGTIQEARCMIKNTNLDFKEIAVSKAETKTFQIKNLSRIQAIFSIDQTNLPECVSINPLKGRIGPDDVRDISVTILSNQENTFKGDIIVYIRGGRILKLPFQGQTIIPQVSILEELFDFGNITTLGNQGILKMSLQNNSNIPADLVLDMRTDEDYEKAQPGIECLSIEIEGEDDDSVLHSVHEEQSEEEDQQNKMNNDDNEPDFDGPLNESVDSLEEESEKKKSKLFNLTVYPKQTLNFVLKFCPKEIISYKLLLPLTLSGYGIIPSLERYITCKGLHPKFLIDPQTCEFKRKVITTPDKCFPDKMEVTLNNPDRRSIKWRIDISGITSDKIFQVEPSSGIVESCDSVKIEALFNPYAPGNFTQTLPLYIEEDDEIPSNVPYVELILKGEAAFPRLQFDRKEIILPVVPLGIQSRCTFRIINDGYENLNLKYKIIQDISNINVTLNWPDGKNLGITKHRIRVEAVFSNKRPLSFTTRIEFYDDSDRVYPIYISGTTDNCLFTNQSYLQRCKGEYSIYLNEVKDDSNKFSIGNIMIKEEDEDINSVDGKTQTSRTHSIAATKKKGGAASTLSYGSTKSSRSMLGYQPIPTPFLDQSIEYITRWLNYHVLQQPINSFPQSVIEQNGSPVFDLITFLTGRTQFPFRAQIDHLTKRTEKSKKLMSQYDELIRSLKVEGGMLNHIRPEYLLSYQDYILYVKQLPSQVTNTISQNVLRLSQSRFMYLALDSWIQIFYQILKIYFLNRLNAKNFKLIPGIPAEKMQIPNYIEQSNLISPAESLLLYWLEINYEQTHPLAQKRLCSFDLELQDGQWIQSLIMSYVGKNSSRYFGNMKMVCSNEQDFKYNGERIVEAMKEIGINSHLQPQDFQKVSMREMILFNLQMLYSLPHYIPKGNPIMFSCILGEEITKNIELTNPTNRTICYHVKLEGHPDFSLDSEDQFMIEPKSQYKFRVKFTSRVSDSVTGRIIFNNKKESNVQAAALVFDLKSNVTGRISEKIIQTTSNLYENTEFQFQVTNKFQNAEWGEFEVNIVHVKPEKPVEKKKKKAAGAPQQNQNNTKGKQNGGKEEDSDKPQANVSKIEDQQQNDVFPSFFCRQYNTAKLRIKRGATANINLIFLPLIIEQQRCYIIFKDPNIGEFQYEVIGNVELPMYNNEIIRLPQNGQTIYVDDPANIEIPLSYQNESMNRARKLAEQLIMEKSKEKFLKGDKSALQKADKLVFPGGQPDAVQYNIEITPSVPYIQIPQIFTLTNPYKGLQINQPIEKEQKQENSKRGKILPKENHEEQQEQTQTVDLVNKLPISLLFKNAVKDFKVSLTLKNVNLTDIRRYKLEISAFPKPVRSTLEFRVPARQSTTQEIPIVNNTERDWNIKVNFVRDKLPNSNLFSFPASFSKEFLVRKKSQGSFPLTFKPKWICEAECKLILQNPLTNDLFEYNIKGFGEEPVAEDHFVIQCSARQTKIHDIVVKNPYTDKDVTYKVETDLLNAQGAPSLKIKAGQKGTYKLSVTPILSGQYTGSITFTEDDGTYLWYTVVLLTASPAADKVLDLNSFIRQACTFEISISNPLDQQISFDVIINGDGLIGENIFYLGPKETKSYELIYSPLYIGKAKGSIAFVNEHLGEKWYELNLLSEEQAVIKLPILKTELGKFNQHKVQLENPTDKEIKAISKCTNTQNFEVFPQDIVLKPFSSTTVYIRHSPSSLEQAESAEISIITGEIGKWRYSVYGMGIPPTKFEKREISVSINKDFSTSIQFKNPFKEQIQIQVYMIAENQNKEVFKLLLKGKKIPGKQDGEERYLMQVGGLQVLMIPFSFIPREITKYYCEIVLAMNDKIEWRYPIEGITQCTQSTVIQNFKCQCRDSLEEDFSIQLPGIQSIMGKDDTFSFEIRCLEEEYSNLVDKSLQIKTTKNYLSDPSDRLEFQVKFQPLKPYKATLEFHVLRKAGGKWRYFIDVEATEPEPDDTIVISSNLHKTTSVSFKLTNKTKQFAPFVANFSPESDSEFTVFPKSGTLESYGRDGTTFIVSFTPVEYGKIRSGKLIVQTEDMYWQNTILKFLSIKLKNICILIRSYLIKGKLPKYNPPQAESSLIDDKLEAEFDLRVNSTLPKNHLLDNIKKTKINASISKNLSRSIQNSNDSTNLISRTIGQINNLSSSISYIGKNPQ